MKIIEKPSPNHDARGAPVDMLVLHYTGMPTAQAALEKMTDPTPGKRVSAHYMVDEDGAVYRLVPEDRRAWHAGVSSWRGQSNINDRSIGIEIVNPGHEYGYRPFPSAQMQAVAELSKDIVKRHNIPAWNVVGHSDIAPSRKQDPGELFDWKMLAAQGVGLWPAEQKEGGADPLSWVWRVIRRGVNALTPAGTGDVLSMQKDLVRAGYNSPLCGSFGEDTRAAVTAFQRHFRPKKVSGAWDEECASLLKGLLARMPHATLAEPDGRMAAGL